MILHRGGEEGKKYFKKKGGKENITKTE